MKNRMVNKISGLLAGVVLVLCCTAVFSMAAGTQNEEGLHTLWSELLGKYVANSVVDYTAMKAEENVLDDYLKILDATNPETLERSDRLALYINAYNSCTVKLILDNFSGGKPVSSIKKLGGFFSGPWKIQFCPIGGKTYTLDEIEHEIIRPQFNDPRVHFAVNCASKSCPPLIGKAYQGKSIDTQLKENTVAFLNDKQFNYLEGKTLYVSKIFDWFPEDFNNDIPGFVKKYAKGQLLKTLNEYGDTVNVEYLDYDWSLNGY